MLSLVRVLVLALKEEFASRPKARREGIEIKIKITFSLKKPIDDEVAVLNAKGRVLRHVAAGMPGASSAPPPPLEAGLAQALTWDGKEDGGKPAPLAGLESGSNDQREGEARRLGAWP